MADSTLRVARARVLVAASAADCWRAFTDVSAITSWHAERVDGELAEGREVVYAWDSLGQALALEVVEARCPHTLRLRHQPPSRPSQEQAVHIRERGASTEVEIVHGGFRDGPGGDDERAGTEAGWQAALAMLRLYLERYPGRSRSVVGAIGASGADLPTAYRELTSRLGLGDCSGGESMAVVFGAGARLRGEVLVAAPPYQVLVDLPEIRGALALRAFSIGIAGAPQSAILAAQLWTWGDDPSAVDALRPAVEATLDEVIGSLGGPTAEA